MLILATEEPLLGQSMAIQLLNCLDCQNSACCRDLDINISKKEYYSLKRNIRKVFLKSSDAFFAKHPERKSRILKKEIEANSGNFFAKMQKDSDGYCFFLDKKSKLCTVYDDRPQICRSYKTERCEKIRLIND